LEAPKIKKGKSPLDPKREINPLLLIRLREKGKVGEKTGIRTAKWKIFPQQIKIRLVKPFRQRDIKKLPNRLKVWVYN